MYAVADDYQRLLDEYDREEAAKPTRYTVESAGKRGAWQVSNGDGTAQHFNKHNGGKRAAVRRALVLNQPVAHRLWCQMANTWRQLESRGWKALEIIDNDGITPAAANDPGAVAYVAANDQLISEYRITADEEGFWCECKDFQDGNAPMLASGQTYCKHILAAIMQQRIS